MKKLIVISAVVAIVLVSSSWVERVYKSAGPPSCHAGEPPNNTNCTDCHNDGTANTGLAQVLLDLDGAENGYVPGQTYTITVSVSRADMKRAGFQCIALLDSDNKTSPGMTTLTDPDRTQLLDKNTPHSGGCLEEERVWIEHTYNGNGSNDSGISRWSYQWKAPLADVGTISFYLAALEANNDLAETGDQVYTRKKTISAKTTGIALLPKRAAFVVYPTPAAGVLNIRLNGQEPQLVTLANYSGVVLKEWSGKQLITRNGDITVPVADVLPGIYFLLIKIDGVSEIHKVVIL